MGKAILKRIGMAIPTLLLVVVISFLLVRVIPGDPISMKVGDNATELQRQEAIAQLGYDKPLPVQFLQYCRDLLHGDLGVSWHTSNPVSEDLRVRFPATLELALWALLLALLIGIPLGILSAVWKDSIVDHLCRILSMLGASMPIFWLGLLLIYYFCYQTGTFPAPLGRLGLLDAAPVHKTGLYVLDALLSGDLALAKKCASYLFLPAVCLSMPTMAILARMTRTSMLEQLTQDYVRTARAKGLTGWGAVCRHALSNAWIPILTVLGSQFGSLMGSTVVCETIFSWPGIGSYLTQSILVTDYNPIQAFTLLSAVIYLAINLLLEILYAVADPRVRLT